MNLTCKEATRMMSEGLDRDLSAYERLQLRLHLFICDGCANFRRQMDFLRLACRRYAGRHGGGDPPPRT